MSPKRDDWQEIAGRLRTLVKRGEQKEIAKELGITPGALSRYLNGERVPSDPVLALRLCSLLGVDLAEVVGKGKGRPRTPQAFTAPLRRLAERLASVSRETSEIVARMETEAREEPSAEMREGASGSKTRKH